MQKCSPAPRGSSSSIFFAKGQLWQIGPQFIKIGHVGRLLVHHRSVDPVSKRTSRESLSAIESLHQFLKENKAVLVSAK